MIPSNAARNSQTKTGSASRRVPAAHEALRDRLHFVGSDSDPVIRYRNGDHPVLPMSYESNVALLPGVFDGVVDEIPE
jgi:hypothetical protein